MITLCNATVRALNFHDKFEDFIFDNFEDHEIVLDVMEKMFVYEHCPYLEIQQNIEIGTRI